MEEKRSAARDKELPSQLFDMLREMQSSQDELNQALINHMQREEHTVSKILERLAPLGEIMESMPRDEHNAPSPYLHRVQHDAMSAQTKALAEVRKGVLGKVGEMLLLATIVVLASGNWTALTQWLANR